jgi:hypothetical protein
MTTSNYPGAAWRKSTHSNGQAECVEIARNLPGITAIRDSKNPHGPTLVFSHQQWHAFAAKLKTSARTCRFSSAMSLSQIPCRLNVACDISVRSCCCCNGPGMAWGGLRAS